MRVTNRIQDCAAVVCHAPTIRGENLIDRVAIHRCSFRDSEPPFQIADEALDSVGLAARFANTERYSPGYYTKGTIPYTFLIRPNGRIEQLLPVRAVSAHALRWNVPAVGIAVIGDFRTRKPGDTQWEAAVAFCVMWKSFGLKMYGHDELPFASTDPRKECPGKNWSMGTFRALVRRAWERSKSTRDEARSALEAIGVVF